MENLQRRRSGIYVARLTVPARLRPLVGKREFIASTGTAQLSVAKIAAGALLFAWRRHLLELERDISGKKDMDHDSIIRIADGHVALGTDTHLPLARGAALLALDADALLRLAVEGRLNLFARLASVRGFLLKADALERDDPEEGTRLIPSPSQMPPVAARHAANGPLPVDRLELDAVASQLLAVGEAPIVAFTQPGSEGRVVFVPDDPVHLTTDAVEVSTRELEALRGALARQISPERLVAARDAVRNLMPGQSPADAGRHVSEAVIAFMQDRSKRCSTEHARRIQAACNLFVELMNDPPAHSVNRAMMRRYKDHVLPTVPARENQVREQFGSRNVTESIAVANERNLPRLSEDEQVKRLRWFGECVSWMAREGWISSDPMQKLVVAPAQRGARDQDRRAAFSDDDLRIIFSAPWFATGRGEQTAQGTYREYMPLYYWLPALGLFTGARINELCQLDLSDIRLSAGGVWFLDINDDREGKRLKNANSKRLIPIHPQLIEWGLIRWRDRLIELGEDRLFPELRFDSAKGYSKDAVKWFSRFLAGRGLPRDGTRVFHSFRHRFATDCLNRLGLPEPIVAQLTGHARGSSVLAETYRKDAPPDDLVKAVARLDFDLPAIGTFDREAGVKALKDAARRKNGGRGY